MNNLTKLLGIIALATVMGFSFTACDDQPDSTTYPNPATITQANGLAFPGKVTIKSSDPYTDAQWNDIVEKVITKLNAAYAGAAHKGDFDAVFGSSTGAQIVLVNNLAKNWEVKKTLPEGTGVYGTLYIKADSINSISVNSYAIAIDGMFLNMDATSQTNATPAKHRVFLATVLGTKNGMYAI
jgi:hypothetical protein